MTTQAEAESFKDILNFYSLDMEDLQTPFDIPNNWIWARLENIARIEMGQSPDSSKVNEAGDGMPFYQGKSEFGAIFPTPRRWCTQPKKIAFKGDVLISVRAPVGPTNLCRETSCIGRGLAAIRPLEGVSSYYLLFGLRAFSEVFEKMGVGSTFAGINSQDLNSFLFPVPPVMEQQRIVSKIEELMNLCDVLEKQQAEDVKLRQKAFRSLAAKLIDSNTDRDLLTVWNKYASSFMKFLNTVNNIDSAKETLRTLAALGKLEEFSNNDNPQEIIDESIIQKQSLLASKEITRQQLLPPLFRNEINQTYPSHWSVARFDDLANLSGGVTKGKRYRGRKTSNYPYLRVANVQRGYFLLDDVQEIEIPDDEFEKYSLKDGDILITEGGDWDKVGRTAIWRSQIPNCLHQNHVFKARLLSSKIMKEWIELVFNSSIGRQYWESASKQTTNLASINMTQVRSFPVPIPSQQEQGSILNQLRKLLSICDELKENIGKFLEVQENFSKAVIYSILHDESRRIAMPTEENMVAKSFKRQISVKIALATITTNDLSNTKLAIILQENGGMLEAKELWKASELEEIDDFYAFLKQEIKAGFIQEPKSAALKLVEVVE